MGMGVSLPAFYRGRSGRVVQRLLRARLAALWPDVRGQRVLGIGAAGPYLPLWREEAALCIDGRLPCRDVAGLRGCGIRRVVLADDALPLPDLSIDRILLVHGLELATDARRLLRECWRVLKDDGLLLAVVPNRVGIWAHAENTPFGEGRPYTQGQVADLLRDAMFTVERREHALFVPPVDWSPLLRSAALVERLGRRLAPHFGGLILAEAMKDVYAAAPVGHVGRRRIIQPPPLRLVRAA